MAAHVEVLSTSLPGPRQSAAAMPELIDALPGGDQPELMVCNLIDDASDTSLRVEGNWPRHWEA